MLPVVGGVQIFAQDLDQATTATEQVRAPINQAEQLIIVYQVQYVHQALASGAIVVYLEKVVPMEVVHHLIVVLLMAVSAPRF